MITPLPDPPLPTDSRTDFNAKAFAFIAAMNQMVVEFNEAATAYALSLASTSTTSLTVGLGTKNLTVQTGKGYLPGQQLVIANTPTPTNLMAGSVVSYDTNTGALVMTITNSGGSGTFTAWTISPTTVASFDGQTFTDLVLAGRITETPYSLSGTAIDPANGTLQYKTLSGNTTFTSAIAAGQSVTLILTKGAHTVTWPTMDWVLADPTLSSTQPSVIVLFNVTGTLTGIYCGPTQ